jgi:hypothetical protein
MSWSEITALTTGIIVATALTVFATVYLATIVERRDGAARNTAPYSFSGRGLYP